MPKIELKVSSYELDLIETAADMYENGRPINDITLISLGEILLGGIKR
jgi:hypothetical protein